jgi:hypothetical protein
MPELKGMQFVCKDSTVAECQWFTPVILATQETEIKRITV